MTAIDMNPSQIALLELKIAAIAELNHDAFVCLLGVRDHLDALEMYHQIRSPSPVSRFWDARESDIENGIVHGGRLEAYIRGFQDVELPHFGRRHSLNS